MSTTPIVFDIAVDSDVDIAVGIDKAKISRSRTGSRAAPLCAQLLRSAPSLKVCAPPCWYLLLFLRLQLPQLLPARNHVVAPDDATVQLGQGMHAPLLPGLEEFALCAEDGVLVGRRSLMSGDHRGHVDFAPKLGLHCFLGNQAVLRKTVDNRLGVHHMAVGDDHLPVVFVLHDDGDLRPRRDAGRLCKVLSGLLSARCRTSGLTLLGAASGVPFVIFARVPTLTYMVRGLVRCLCVWRE